MKRDMCCLPVILMKYTKGNSNILDKVARFFYVLNFRAGAFEHIALLCVAG